MCHFGAHGGFQAARVPSQPQRPVLVCEHAPSTCVCAGGVWGAGRRRWDVRCDSHCLVACESSEEGYTVWSCGQAGEAVGVSGGRVGRLSCRSVGGCTRQQEERWFGFAQLRGLRFRRLEKHERKSTNTQTQKWSLRSRVRPSRRRPHAELPAQTSWIRVCVSIILIRHLAR